MKKFLAITLAAIAVMGTMASCSGTTTDGFKDGSYRAEYKDFDDHGWKDYLNVTVADGKITAVEYDSLNSEDGHKKTEDEAYKEAYVGEGFETYPADTADKLEAGLVEKQDGALVDTVAGATNSSDSFKALFAALKSNMAKGDTATVIVE